MPALAASAVGAVPSSAAESLSLRTPLLLRLMWTGLIVLAFHSYAWSARPDHALMGDAMDGRVVFVFAACNRPPGQPERWPGSGVSLGARDRHFTRLPAICAVGVDVVRSERHRHGRGTRN